MKILAAVLPRYSIKAKITLATLITFLGILWTLCYYATFMLREQIEQLSGEQQLSTVTYAAAELNGKLEERVAGLETAARAINASLLSNPAAAQKFIANRLELQALFNDGVRVYRKDGTAIASMPYSSERVGLNYLDRDYLSGALHDGKSTIGRPVVGKTLKAPIFLIAVPILNSQNQVVGALSGVTNLGKPNFLDKISESRYGKSGGYLLVDTQHRLIVTATDKSRIMEKIPVPAASSTHGRLLSGFEGSAVYVNTQGVEVLASHKIIPVSGWNLSAALPTAEAFDPIRGIERRLLLATLLLTLLAGGVIWWVLRRQLSPILKTSELIAAMSDSSKPLEHLPVTQKDEVGQLVAGINQLLESLRQRETTLRENETRFRIISTISSDVLYSCVRGSDGVFNIDWILGNCNRLIGYEQETVRQVGCWRRFLIEDDIAVFKANISTLQPGQSGRVIARFRHFDGTIRSIRCAGYVERAPDEAGTYRLYAALKDVTQQRQAEIALQESEQHYRAIYEASQDLVAIVRLDDRVFVEVNQTYLSTLGYERDELVGHSAQDLHIWENSGDDDEFVRMLNKEDKCHNCEVRLRTKNGQTVWGLRSASVIEINGVKCIFTVTRDITSIKETARELELHRNHLQQLVDSRTIELAGAKTLAEAANRAKSRFLAATSHDLRQPMQAISLFVDSLGRTSLSEEQKNIIGYLTKSTQVQSDLLNALLDISRFDAGVVTPNPETLLVSSLSSKIEAEFSVLAAQKSLQFNIRIPTRDMAVFTDANLLMSLLGNLIGNAIKYTEQGGVLVAMRRRGDKALIQIWDTGIGIEPEYLESIFEEYVQVGNPERDRAKGLGLGLAIAKRIASLLKTEVVCYSRPGKGSVFEFSMPLVYPKEMEPKGRTVATGGATLVKPAGRRIALIENDLMVGIAVKLALESCNMSVTRYSTAEEALADAELEKADFYISDLRLPGMSGVEFLNALQSRSMKPVKAVVMTGDTAVNRIELMGSSSWQMLFKPVDLNKLLSEIEAQDSVQ
ncbi:MAG: PAS domain S-box protein [Betaproteobacteria bacterium]